MTDDPLIGRQLGNYRIQRAIGRGGMAQVYYGQDVKLERPVAIKVIDARYRDKPTYAERFVREARAAAAWRHEHIVQIYYADDEDDLYYFAMEYIDGQDLSQVIADHRARDELMPHQEVLRIGRAFAAALDYIHEQGVIHRDVKPSNVMVADDGRVVLTDFGLALDVEEGSLGEVFGSSHYVAPEQARRSADAVPQSDLYSLGVILYEMLTGIVPFDDPSPTAVAVQHITLAPPPPRQINPDLNQETEAVLLKALGKTHEGRYQTGRELIDALEAALGLGGEQARGDQPAAAPPPPRTRAPDDLVGQQLDEYRLEALLGQGGMARVYRGLDERLNRRVAIKVIDTPFRADADYVARFEREAKAIAQLEHLHIVRLYRYGEADGLFYMAMQYIEGKNLHAVLSAYRKAGELMPPEEVGRIIREVCLALDYAHDRGVIHRDVKPSNIMLDEQGNAILADFGLALLTEVGTRGEILGSPQHIAPEQAISSASVVPQSDLYAVGVILYEMLTGQLPFDAPDPLDLAMLHMSEPPPPPRELRPDISPELEAVVLKALAKDPDDRYPTGAAMADAVDQALGAAPVEEAPIPAAVAPDASEAEREAELPPVPAAVAPQPAGPRPEPPSITSMVSEDSPTPAMPTLLSRFRSRTLEGKRSPIYIVAGACVILLILLAIIFLLLRSTGQAKEPKTESTPLANVVETLPAAPAPVEGETTQVTQSLVGAASRPVEEATQATDTIGGATETPVVAKTPDATELAPSPTATETASPTPEATGTPIEAIPTATPTPALAATVTPTIAPTATLPPYRLAYTRWDGSKHSIWLADLDGNNQQYLLDYAASPSWSPDGEHIAFVGEQGIDSQVGFGSGGVWWMSAAGWSPRQLKQDGAARSVACMPSGDSIAYESNRGDPGVFFVDLYGTDQAGAIPGEHPAWSPDGKQLVVRACRPDCGLWVVNRDNSKPRQLTWGSTDGLPAWSPDGKQVAFSRGGNNTDIYVIKAKGEHEPPQLTDGPGHDTLPAWTPDGGQIVFRTARNGYWQIYIMSADGSDQRLIVDNARVSDEWALDRMSIVELSAD